VRRFISGIAATGLVLVSVTRAGCDDGDGGGVATQGPDSDFGRCVDRAGLPLDGSEEWSAQEEREFLSQPDVLSCVLTDVPADERDDLLSRAFPDDSGTDDAADEARTAKTDALVAYVDARSDVPREQLVTDVAALMDAFGWDETDPWVGARKQVALAIVRVDGGAQEYDAWLSRTGRSDDYDGRIDFVQEQETEGTPLADEVRALADQIESAQDSQD
jgi:hypothetical protein